MRLHRLLRPQVLPQLLALSLLLPPTQASALCRCVCVEGTMRAICQPTDLVVPVCQALCQSEVRAVSVVRPLAGGMPQYAPVVPANPSPGGLIPNDPDYSSDTRGFALGTPGSLTGAGSGGGGGGGGSASGAGGR